MSFAVFIRLEKKVILEGNDYKYKNHKQQQIII